MIPCLNENIDGGTLLNCLFILHWLICNLVPSLIFFLLLPSLVSSRGNNKNIGSFTIAREQNINFGLSHRW